MRPYTILPLLLLLQFTAGAPPCDPSLIKGVPPADIVFDAGTHELTCKDEKEINIDGKAYDKLKCEPDGWKHSNAPLNPEQKADKDLNIKCKAKACDKSYIKGATGGYTFTVQSTGKVLKCNDGKEIEITGHTDKYGVLHCDKDGWKTANGLLNPVQKANEEINIACKAKDPPPTDKCVGNLIKGVPPGEFDFDSNKVLKCKNSKQIIVDNNPPFDELKCDVTEGWKNGPTKINKEAGKDLTIACKAKATPKCDVSLIARIRIPQDGKYNTNKLTCTDPKKGIEFKKELYPEVTCDENDGWKGGPKVLGVAADSKFDGSCVDKACHQSLITGFDESKMTYDSTHKLACKDANEAIEYTVSGKKKLADFATCDPASKWKGQANIDTGIMATAAFAVSCVKKACHEDLITVTDKVDRTVPRELKCKQTGMKLKVDNAAYDKLICDDTLGWKDSNGATAVKQATDRFDVTCEASAPATPCAVKQTVPGIVFDSVKKTLTCDPDVPAEITYQGTPSDCEGFILTCDDANGWTKGTTQFAPANEPLDVTYTKYCETAPDFVYKTSSEGGSYIVTCKGPALMEYNDGSVQPVNEMTCSKAGGWKKDGVDIQKPSSSPLQELTCKKVCNSHKKPNDPANQDATDDSKWDDGLTDLAEPISKGPGKVRFECKNKLIGDKENVIKLDGKLVNSHLYCDTQKGYSDFHGTKLADASATVKIACVDSLCKDFANAISLCQAAVGKIPEGYKCVNDFLSPFSVTDDPNQLNCKNYGRIFDHLSNPPAFIDDVLLCKEKEHWYKYGDAEEKAISNPRNILCMQLRCNACKQLKGTDEQSYTPGTPTKCATHKCANNLWKIKKDTEEEYAGEVTCSAKEGFDGKWVIDENSASPTAIDEGECITSVKTCTTAAKLETACKSEWTNCSPITLNDDNAVSCPDGKKMFYMQRGTANLEEGAESIKCDKTKGVWTVTRSGGNDELRRGGTVVCADSNPAPTTTTTEAPKNPCDLCPKQSDAIKTCETCEAKDLKLSHNETSAKCEASVEFKNEFKFETDKGPVEGKLFCGKPDYKWKDEKGNEVGKFAGYKTSEAKKEDEGQMGMIIGCAVGGAAILIIIAFIIIWTIVITRRRRTAEDEKDEETKKRMLEEGKKRKKQRGDNDEILDEVSVDAPSEIKL